MRYIFIAFIFFSFINRPLFSQFSEWEPTTREVVISLPDSTIRAQVLIKREEIEAQGSLEYFWYKKGVIKSNIGGFTGELLHGSYIIFDNNQNMITKGQIEKGLKTGAWKKWDSEGKLISTEEYKSGERHGNKTFYDKDGNIKQIIEFKNGKATVKKEKEKKEKKRTEKTGGNKEEKEKKNRLKRFKSKTEKDSIPEKRKQETEQDS